MQAANDLIEKARLRKDFNPNLILFYATLKYNGKYQSMLDIFHTEFGEIPQIGASVDGMIFPDDMRTDGATLVLCKDDDARISVKGVAEKGVVKSAEKLARMIKCNNGCIVLHFPLVRVPSILKSAEFFAKGYYYSKLCRGNTIENQKEYARTFAQYCDTDNIFYLPPTILEIFAEQTGYSVPIIGVNVMHTQVRINSPSIFCNFEDIGSGIAALVIEKQDLNVMYDDIFSEKGKTMEETRQNVSKEFKIIKEFKAIFEKNVLISLDGMAPVEAVENLIYAAEKKREELLGKLEKGDYNLNTPYGLLFYNKKTNGVFLLGIGSYYPFEMFPFYVDISDYSNGVVLAYEFVEDKFESFISTLIDSNHNDKFVFFFLDVFVTAAFGEKVLEYKDKVKQLLGENYFGILSFPPSAYIPLKFQRRNCLSESGKNIFFSSGGTNACLEL
ncbi:MAG TPA: FIST N-terminal domain-containing protein [Candidatus Methanoperedens sp.]